MICRIILKVISLSVFLVVTSVYADTGNLSSNSGFDQSTTTSGAFQYAGDGLTVSNWIFDGSTGISNHSPGWGGQGYNGTVAFLQNEGGSVTQFVTSKAKNFEISFDLARRVNYMSGNQSIDVYWDNTLIGNNLTPLDESFTRYVLSAPGLPITVHSLTFRGTGDGPGMDVTAFLDNINIITID